ncbi:PREDICTED: linker for activation of T-cells family member 1 [Chrysochloris asiatica]|uniref:Linker for activation of T-cells family member 1 n=1 Tax=Chrysochloris asiatica TaxID=185453 RepID=A0A9B0U4Z5_CHRAS|nr:PREDICTED: linker for activation of T-cells family member 1 [Chrysochloris asiatica]
MISCPRRALTTASCCGRAGARERQRGAEAQMEAAVLDTVLGLLLLPLLIVLLTVLCLHCRELPASNDSAPSDSLNSSNRFNKRPCEYMEHLCPGWRDEGPTFAPWPPAPIAPIAPISLPAPSFLPTSLSRNLPVLPIPSPQPSVVAHQMSSSQQDSDSANSVPSYENEGPVCEDIDEDEDEDHDRYLEVLPDDTSAPSPSPVESKSSRTHSTVSMDSKDEYVNVDENKESAEASLDGSREYENVSPKPQSSDRTEPATLSSQEVEEEEGAPDYENVYVSLRAC